MSDEDDTLSNEDWSAFLRDHPPTLPVFSYTFRNVEDETVRNELVAAMSPLADIMSRIFPLGGLDGITIANDYADALVKLDRGVPTSTTLEPTAETFGTGMAMTSGVVRDGKFKSHVTFQAGVLSGLISDDAELRELSTHTFMHELGHVAEHTLDDARFGAAMLSPFDDKYEFELYRLSHSCWSEYYASRVSASWGPNALDGLRELLLGTLQQMSERVSLARDQVGYFAGKRNDDAAEQIIDQVSKLMKFSGYVIGHARGADSDPLDPDSEHQQLLDTLGLADWFAELTTTLDALYDARHDWTDLSVFYPLHRAFEAACLQFKLELRRSDEFALAWRIWF